MFLTVFRLNIGKYSLWIVLMDKKVPDVLISGHHKNIEKWRRKESLKKTFEKRPDLLENIELSEEERQLLEDLKY